MDFQDIRKKSLASVKKIGYGVNQDLPLLDDDLELRSQEEIVARSLTLFAVVAASYGFNRASAIEWLKQEGYVKYLSKNEKDFLDSRRNDAFNFQLQVEGLNAFAWALGLIDSMPFDANCDNKLIACFPDIKCGDTSSDYKARSAVRSNDEIFSALDLAYCLHWAIVDSKVRDTKLPSEIDNHVIVERRRALEWMLSTDSWDDVKLDT